MAFSVEVPKRGRSFVGSADELPLRSGANVKVEVAGRSGENVVERADVERARYRKAVEDGLVFERGEVGNGEDFQISVHLVVRIYAESVLEERHSLR